MYILKNVFYLYFLIHISLFVLKLAMWTCLLQSCRRWGSLLWWSQFGEPSCSLSSDFIVFWISAYLDRFLLISRGFLSGLLQKILEPILMKVLILLFQRKVCYIRRCFVSSPSFWSFYCFWSRLHLLLLTSKSGQFLVFDTRIGLSRLWWPPCYNKK